MASARENDLNPDIKIGLELPFARSSRGLFGQTATTLEQAGHNIKNLLLTSKGERVMQPDFGSDLRSLLFEQADDNINNDIKEAISDAMSNWLPYINISNVNVIENETNLNQIKVVLLQCQHPEPISLQKKIVQEQSS